MRLTSLQINRKTWGPDEGKLFGAIEFDSSDAKITHKLSEEQANRILAVVADSAVESAKEVSKIIREQITQQFPQIAAPVVEVK